MQQFSISGKKIRTAASACAARGKIARACGSKDRRDVLLFQAALCGEEFKAVALKGQVARRDHHCAVKFPTFHYGGHKHSRRGAKAKIRNLHPGSRKAVPKPRAELLARKAGIAPNGNALRPFAQTALQPPGKRAADGAHGRFRQIHRLSAFHRDCDAADIASVLELFIVRHIL